MKKVKTYLFLAGLGLISSNTNAQYVYIIHPDDTVTKPTHIIDLVYEMGEADWIVAITVDRQEAERQEGMWFFVQDPSKADFLIRIEREPMKDKILVYLTENELRVRVDY
jgi:hypothetical protein